MRRSAALVLVLLVLTAGCSLPFGPDGGDAREPTAETEVTPTAGTPSLSTREAPPGVSAEERRVTNATALTRAHTRALVEFGFETDVRTNATVFQRSGVEQVQRRQQTAVEPHRAQYVYRLANPNSRIDGWGNRSLQAVRARAGGQVTYRVRDRSATARQLSGVAAIIGPCLDESFVVGNVTRAGDETRVLLTSREVPEDGCLLPDNATNVSDYEARAVVDSAGRIHEFVVTANYTLRGEAGRLRVTFGLVRAQVDGFDRPDWVETALNRSG